MMTIQPPGLIEPQNFQPASDVTHYVPPRENVIMSQAILANKELWHQVPRENSKSINS